MKLPHLATELMETLLSYHFEEESLDHAYCLDVLRLMEEIKRISCYDASYHVLAIRSNGTYVTADQEYIKKAKRKGYIIPLADWPLSKTL